MLKEILREISSLFFELIEKEEFWLILFLILITIYVSLDFFNLEVNFQDLKIFLINFFDFVYIILKELWFFWIFLFLFFFTKGTWLFYRQELFKKNIDWALLEIKFPKVNDSDPKSMEVFLTNLLILKNEAKDIKSKFIQGEISRWFSLEIVSLGGQIHFYIRTYKKFIKLIESFFYSVYPNAELIIVEQDYINFLPRNLEEVYKLGMDLWGTEFILVKDSFYPILSYNYFLNKKKEDKFNDPIFELFEVMGRINKGDFLGFQILIRPKGSGWSAKWKDKIENLKKIIINVNNQVYQKEINLVKELENNINKPAFDVVLRVLYLSPKEMFFDSFVRNGLFSYLNRFSSIDLNAFKPNVKASTTASSNDFPYFFVKERTEIKKQRFLINYRLRNIPPENFFSKFFTSHILDWNDGSRFFELNVEGLATLFHLPTEVILFIPYVESKIMNKRTSPPSDLPIFGSEEDIEKFNY